METQRKLELNPINARTQQTIPPPTRFPLSPPTSHRKCPVAQIRLYQPSLPPPPTSIHPSPISSPPPPPLCLSFSCLQHIPYLHMDSCSVAGAWRALWWFDSCWQMRFFFLVLWFQRCGELLHLLLTIYADVTHMWILNWCEMLILLILGTPWCSSHLSIKAWCPTF